MVKSLMETGPLVGENQDTKPRAQWQSQWYVPIVTFLPSPWTHTMNFRVSCVKLKVCNKRARRSLLTQTESSVFEFSDVPLFRL